MQKTVLDLAPAFASITGDDGSVRTCLAKRTETSSFPVSSHIRGRDRHVAPPSTDLRKPHRKQSRVVPGCSLNAADPVIGYAPLEYSIKRCTSEKSCAQNDTHCCCLGERANGPGHRGPAGTAYMYRRATHFPQFWGASVYQSPALPQASSLFSMHIDRVRQSWAFP